MKEGYLSYLIELLSMDEWINAGENVNIAKGQHAIPKTWRQFIKHRSWRK